MSKGLLEAAERIAEALTTQERLQLAKELAQQTRRDRWNRLFALIDARVKRWGSPSESEILQACREVRRERTSSHRGP